MPMKLALNSESAAALRELADGIPTAIANITDDTIRLIDTFQSVSDMLGVHRDDFYLMLLHVQKAQMLSVEALEILPSMMRKTADKIDAYVASRPNGTSFSSSYSASPDAQHNAAYNPNTAYTPKVLSCHEILETFGVAPCRNGTDVFVKGDNFAFFEEIYYAADDFPSQAYDNCIETDIAPGLIEGIHLGKSEAENPAVFWQQHKDAGTAESFQEIASHIPEVRRRIALGATLSELDEDPLLSECAGIYFRNKPEVIKCYGYYEFVGNGRHRILAARALGYSIPVKVVGERRRKTQP